MVVSAEEIQQIRKRIDDAKVRATEAATTKQIAEARVEESQNQIRKELSIEPEQIDTEVQKVEAEIQEKVGALRAKLEEAGA
jgi:hypothetical protein